MVNGNNIILMLLTRTLIMKMLKLIFEEGKSNFVNKPYLFLSQGGIFFKFQFVLILHIPRELQELLMKDSFFMIVFHAKSPKFQIKYVHSRKPERRKSANTSKLMT